MTNYQDKLKEVIGWIISPPPQTTDGGVAEGVGFDNPLVPPGYEPLRSGMPMVNEIAVGRYVCLALIREKFALAGDAVITVKSIVTERQRGECRQGEHHSYSGSAEVSESKGARVDGVRASLVHSHNGEVRRVHFHFGVLTPSAARFIRKSRGFEDAENIRLERQLGHSRSIDLHNVEYLPGEADRIVDGTRMDHIPALHLIDIMVSLSNQSTKTDVDNMTAVFHRYVDPRYAFHIITSDDGTIAVSQDQSTVSHIRFERSV
ncbi:hypothetical protein [Nguyenibacter vanlangensis]|uniref:Uncharacterized protein n=1 Tax=Nguyenibacter vanlangensis TaxID=1216886 RepID=A0A7Y7M5P6_9PROT|nr:hypothetical protein [Nguyenibacter vanlangensis]NVN10074.1 hypothetical protein [Nguyenibacter vanlangensis]